MAAIRAAAYRDGHSAGWDAGWDRAINFVIARMTDVGLDPDILAVGEDDQGAEDK